MMFDTPARLAEKLQAGELDAALVPIFHVLRNPGYLIVDDLCIGCRGPVYSVVVAHHGDVDQIRGLQLSEDSMTSNALARIILTLRGASLRVVSAGLRGEAEVIIGDAAIEKRLKDPHGANFLDLGTEWLRFTGLPFVFAVWAIREDVAGAPELASQLRACAREGLSKIAEVVRTAPRDQWPFARVYLTQFIKYELGADQKAAITEFQRRCINLCVLEETHPLRFI
jgi:predicted solute-binding protein